MWSGEEPVLEGQAEIVQPDVSPAGGISEVRRIGAQAELHDALTAPHCPLGPIALAASMQLDLATPNFLIQEQSFGMHYGGSGLVGYLLDASALQQVDGYVPRLTRPDWASRSTRSPSTTLPRRGINGGRRSGGTVTVAWPIGNRGLLDVAKRSAVPELATTCRRRVYVRGVGTITDACAASGCET